LKLEGPKTYLTQKYMIGRIGPTSKKNEMDNVLNSLKLYLIA